MNSISNKAWIYFITLLFICAIFAYEVSIERTPLVTAILSPQEKKSLQEGDIILRESTGVGGYMIKKYLKDSPPLTHVGIISKSNDSWRVIQTTGGGTGKNFQFGMHTVSLDYYCSIGKKNTLVVTRLKNGKGSQILIHAQTLLKNGKSFDYDYDLRNEDKMHCTEVVYSCVKKATGEDFFNKRMSEPGKSPYILLSEFLQPEHFITVVNQYLK